MEPSRSEDKGESRPLIAVIGDGSLEPDSPRSRLAFELGRRLVDAGYRIVCGGRGGIMEAACRGAHASSKYASGDTVGILPGDEPSQANAFVDVVIPTGLSDARNLLVAHAEAVIAIGGGAGTLTEIGFSWILDRLVIAFRVEGWSGELADRRVDERTRFDHLPDDRVYGVDRPEEAVALLETRLDVYRRG